MNTMQNTVINITSRGCRVLYSASSCISHCLSLHGYCLDVFFFRLHLHKKKHRLISDYHFPFCPAIFHFLLRFLCALLFLLCSLKRKIKKSNRKRKDFILKKLFAWIKLFLVFFFSFRCVHSYAKHKIDQVFQRGIFLSDWWSLYLKIVHKFPILYTRICICIFIRL